MPTRDLNSAEVSNMTDRVDAVEVSAMSTDGVHDQEETYYDNAQWTQYWGYFNQLPELKSAITMKAIWTVGKGFKTDPETQVILDHIRGWGKDTFEDIIFNMEVTKRIGGDAFAEIIRGDDKAETIINLKPLDPATIRIVVDRKGMIKRYEQMSKTDSKAAPKRFKPQDIFHLCHNRLADQIHGISDILAMETTILADNESFNDNKILMHRQARPMIMFKLGTDDPGKIATFVSKMDSAVNKGENIYIPNDENSVDFEVIQINPSQVVLDWRNDMKNRFYRSVGLPQIIFGSSGTTESGGKIEYLAHEQVFEKDQKALERQIWEQLNLKIDLNPPTSLLENLQADDNKDAAQGLEIQPSDVTAGSGR